MTTYVVVCPSELPYYLGSTKSFSKNIREL